MVSDSNVLAQLMPHQLAYYLLTKPHKQISDMARQFIAWLKEEAGNGA